MLNTCFATTESYHTIAYYSHLVPVAISLLLVIFVLTKSKISLLSQTFAWFVLGFCFWLIGDVIIWTNQDYHLITALWAPLDYINVLFYLFAAYFFVVLVANKDMSWWMKAILLALSLPAWWITATGQSITSFNQPVCEAYNNEFLTNYKLAVEVLVVAFIMIYGAIMVFSVDRVRRKQILLVGLALVLFLVTFMSTEYISSVTGIYEMNLYSLFVLPLFIAMIIFSITNLKIFAYRTFGLQLLIYVLLIMVGSQYFLLQDATYKTLTLVTFGLSAFLGIVLAKNLRREEQLALELAVANEGQATLIHFINHQIKGYLNKARIVFSELLTEPEYGPVTDPAKQMLSEGEGFMTEGVDFVQQILRASDIEKGIFKYDMRPLDLKTVVSEVANEQRKDAESKGLKFEVAVADTDFKANGDANQLREAVKNLITNSILYTPSGSISVKLERVQNRAVFSVKDTGVGLSDEVKLKLFTKGGRSADSQKINVNSTGYGLAIVKGIAEAHRGKVWAESPGPGKGSTFYMELPLA